MPSTVRERLAWSFTPEVYDKVRRLWIEHSLAEDRRDLVGLLATLTPDCVYEVVPTGQRWQGHAGARTFYESFLGAFPNVNFNLIDIVIGPQGVIGVAEMTGTHQGPWSGMVPTGRMVRLVVIIHFPWDPVAEKFAGERIHLDRAALGASIGEPS
jgi:predicted ester cyclase